VFDYREVTAPYPGLRPFEPFESEIFFGREGHTDRLLEILQRERFLAVIGPSGCGKSSLVRAGLLPGIASGALGSGSAWRIAILRPGSQPVLALAQALLGRDALGRELVGEARLPQDAEDVTADVALVAAELRRDAQGLAGLVQSAYARLPQGADPFNLLLLVDQFEELYTYADARDAQPDETNTTPDTDTPDEPQAFVDLLLAARVDPHIYVALTMRSDFLGNCVRFLELPEAINRAQYLTPRLNPEEMRRAIAGPARVFGGDVDDALVGELITAVSRDSDQLPLLQHALARMWRVAEQLNPDAPLIDESCVAAVGGVAEALNRHADEVLAALTAGQQALAAILFRAITERRDGGQEVRRPQSLAAIAAWGGVAADDLKPVIRAFAAPEVSFLHHGRDLTDSSVIDLTHEALMRQWHRLQRWVEDESRHGQGYRHWSQRALEERNGGLLSGGELARALEWWPPGAENAIWQPTPNWAARYSEFQGAALAEEFERIRRFLCDSRDEEQRRQEQEQKRLEQEAAAERQRADQQRQLAQAAGISAGRAKRWTKIAAVVAVLAVFSAGVAYSFKQQAQIAERQRTASLFDSQITHASLLARGEDYAEARRVLADSVKLDADIPSARRHARNLLAGYVEMMGGQAEQVYTGAGAALVGGAALSPDGKLLAAAGERGTLVLFDATSGKLLLRLEGHDANAGQVGAVFSVVFDHRGRWLFSCGEDGRIIRWSLPTGEKLSEWQAPDAVQALALSPDGATLASGGKDGRISLWSVADGKTLRILKGHTDAIAQLNGLAFSPDGSRLASASYDKTARIWDSQKGETLLTLKGHSENVDAVAFSPDGKRLATASDDKQVMLWDAATGNLLRALRGHSNMVFGVAFSTDGRRIVSVSRDRTLCLRDADSGITMRVYQGHEGGLLSMTVRGDRIYTAANDGTVRRWQLTAPELWETGGSPQATAISPDGTKVALGMRDGTLRLYALPGGNLLAEQARAHEKLSINRIAFNRDGSLIATAGMDNNAKLWRVAADGGLTLLHTLEGHTNAVYAVAFSPDDRRLATAGYDGKIGLFDVVNGQGSLFPAHQGNVASIAFNRDHLLSAGIEDRRLRLWDSLAPGSPPQKIGLAQDNLLWASLSPGGLEAAAVGRDQVVTLYNLANPGSPRRLVGHENTVYRAIYSPDGRQLATVSMDMTVRLWDLDSQRLLFMLRLPTEMQHPSPLWDFDFRCTAAGDCWIAVPLTVGRLALYRLPYEHPPAPPASNP